MCLKGYTKQNNLQKLTCAVNLNKKDPRELEELFLKKKKKKTFVILFLCTLIKSKSNKNMDFKLTLCQNGSIR